MEEQNNNRNYKKYYLLLIPLALFFGFAGYWQFYSIQGKGLDYETETVKEDTLEVKVSGSGTIIASEMKDIKSEISGTVEEVLISNGDTVEKDQELLKIKNDGLDAIKAERWAEYLKAVDDLEKIYANPDAPESEKKSGEANKESAKLNHQLAEDMVNKKTIRSPIGGTIVKLNIKVGDTIDISEEIKDDEIIKVGSSSLMTILDLDKLEAQVAIDEKDLPKISISQAATLSLDALKDKTLIGAVTDIDSIGTKNKGLVTYNVDIAIEDLKDSNIKPGMSVDALININKERNILLVPNDALKMEGERYYIEVLKNNTPQKRIVKIGLSNDKYTQVLDGLKLGEAIIVGATEKNMESNILKAIQNF
ncbi:MAG: efflux RND transporter periplasmic adaptor subunit [Parcubacteria group bacterium]|nr:efflux RND transporter periplasmic adaptor subunit [Parcubacteria group bacterium]